MRKRPRPPRARPVEIDGHQFIPAKDVSEITGLKLDLLRDWARAGVTSNGWQFHSHKDENGCHLIREDTVQQLKERFFCVPSNKPAGPVELGFTPDQTGYIPINRACRLIEELQEWFTPRRIEDLAKLHARGQAPSCVELELIVDPLHRGQRFATERSLRALMQAAKEGKI